MTAQVSDAATLAAASAAADAVRLAQRIVDAPPNEMIPSQLVAEADAVKERLAAKGVAVTGSTITGEALRDGGYGGLWGVGKCAESPPALVVLTATFDREGRSAALVGKGICFDTGGLSLKVGGGMVGMKSDLGGAAACLGAFEAACALGGGDLSELHCVLCVGIPRGLFLSTAAASPRPRRGLAVSTAAASPRPRRGLAASTAAASPRPRPRGFTT